jgi:hypothetical protein
LTKNTARVAARANDDVADPEVVMSTRLTAADVTICACEEDHVAAITTIYAHHVLHGLASFEIEPPSEDDMRRRRLDIVGRNYPYLVAEWTMPGVCRPSSRQYGVRSRSPARRGN